MRFKGSRFGVHNWNVRESTVALPKGVDWFLGFGRSRSEFWFHTICRQSCSPTRWIPSMIIGCVKGQPNSEYLMQNKSANLVRFRARPGREISYIHGANSYVPEFYTGPTS